MPNCGSRFAARDADLRARRVNLRFRRADVGALIDELRRYDDRQLALEMQRVEACRGPVCVGRVVSSQHRDQIALLTVGFFERRQQRLQPEQAGRPETPHPSPDADARLELLVERARKCAC